MPPPWKHVDTFEVVPLVGDGSKVLFDDGDWKPPGAGGGPHAASHATAGSDPVSPASIGAPTQVALDAVQTDLTALSDLVTDHIAVAALDTEVAAAVSAHEAAPDPHSQYAADSHQHNASDINAGTLPIARGGTGLTALGTPLHHLRVNAGGTALEYAAESGGGGFSWHTVVKQAADLAHASANFVNTDLVFSFDANRVYLIDLYLMCTSVAATTGYRFAFDVSAAVTAVGLQFAHELGSGTLSGGRSIADDTATNVSTGVPSAGALNILLAQGILVSGANTGTCRLRFGPEVAASATLKARSTMRVHDALAA